MSVSSRLRRLEQLLGPAPPPSEERLLPAALGMALSREEVERLKSLCRQKKCFALMDGQIHPKLRERYLLAWESAALYLTGKSYVQLRCEAGESWGPQGEQEYQMMLEAASLDLTGKPYAEWQRYGLRRYISWSSEATYPEPTSESPAEPAREEDEGAA